MAKPGELAPIIIKRKKHGKHPHHGGAWKVAYADFVTALMALFIVLWLLGASQKVKESVAGYFKDPSGKSALTGSGQAGVGEDLSVERKEMEKLKEKIEEAFKKIPDLKKDMSDRIDMVITGEGLRIEFTETEQGLFFLSASPQPTLVLNELLTALAKEVGEMPNPLLIEGHTDSRPFSTDKGYTNWELSADRANSARRVMDKTGVKPHQITQVRGFADQRLRDKKNPANPTNRRISIVVRYHEDETAEIAAKPAPAMKPEAPKKASH